MNHPNLQQPWMRCPSSAGVGDLYRKEGVQGLGFKGFGFLEGFRVRCLGDLGF